MIARAQQVSWADNICLRQVSALGLHCRLCSLEWSRSQRSMRSMTSFVQLLQQAQVLCTGFSMVSQARQGCVQSTSSHRYARLRDRPGWNGCPGLLIRSTRKESNPGASSNRPLFKTSCNVCATKHKHTEASFFSCHGICQPGLPLAEVLNLLQESFSPYAELTDSSGL